MTKNKRLRRVSLLICTLFLMFSVWTVHAQEAPGISVAPLNPAFLDAISKDVSKVQLQTVEGYSMGLIPSPVDLSHLKGQQVPEGPQVLVFDPVYDLRTLGKLTPVRDQGDCGSCWSFATYGSLESILMPGEGWDFSENNMKNTHGFDFGHCDGGNAFMSAAYLTRWSGPVSEADDLYNVSSDISPPGLAERKHIQEVLIVPDSEGPLDNDNIKQAVMNYGAVYTSMYIAGSYYNSANSAYYYNGSADPNHAVAIVGWDDYFSKSKFSPPQPPQNGAFIVRNSWGTDFGEAGYFYISYYDSKIGTENFVFNGAEPADNYIRIYQYDPLGWIFSMGYLTTTAWFANVFTSAGNEQLSAVSFYTADLNSAYELYVYSDAVSGPRSGSLEVSKTGAIALPGYHTIPLDSTLPLTAGQKFSVVVKLTTSGYIYPIPVEDYYGGYSSGATANAGESYISSDGNYWEDITDWLPDANVCLKAFAAANPVDQPEISISPASHDFLDINTGSMSGPQEFTISNTGTADLAVTSIELTGGDSAMFSIYPGGSHPCPGFTPTITPGNSCTVIVRFTPSSEGMKSATLRVISNDPAGINDSLLSGTGTASPVFEDVPGTFWAEDYINSIYYNGITTGCTETPLNYCPSNNVTRQAMAVFIIRALFGETFDYTLTPFFTDVSDTSQFFKYVQKMKDEGITTGCTATEYCPVNNVTRQAMAAFIIRALFGEIFDYTTSPYFIDVPDTSQFFKYVQKLKDEGITTGCTATEYCPLNNVTRAAMAAFLARAFLGMP